MSTRASAPGSAPALPAIELRDVGKRYVKYEDTPMLLTSVLRLGRRSRRHQLWALRHCTMDVAPGESIGVIGRNGSGKSTLLQLIAGVTAPTEGRVAVRGRVAPLVQVGVGFHPELTGRENVYVNATILGLDRATIDARFRAIVDFAELNDFIDTPVKFYSSGMYVRLGFSVAVAAEPDVLLVDEVLAVGDLAFQAKCFERMAEIRQRGTTMVVVSHNMNAIRSLCDRALLLDSGRVLVDGAASEAIARYFEIIATSVLPQPTAQGSSAEPARVAVVRSVELRNHRGEPARTFSSGEVAEVAIVVEYLADVAEPTIGVSLSSAGGVHVYADHLGEGLTPRLAGEVVDYRVRLPLPLASGAYSLDCGLLSGGFRGILAWSPPILFHVLGRSAVSGVVDLRATIEEATVVTGDAPAPPREGPREVRPPAVGR